MNSMNEMDSLLLGAVDMHLHHAPDIVPMRIDALEAAEQAKDAGMRAIVLKSHNYPTVPLAILVSKLVPDIKVFGSICLDYEVGGLNYHALEMSAKLGAKVVWMATTSAANSRAIMSNSLGLGLEGDGYSILEKNGEPVPEIQRILSIVKEYDMVLASAHLSPREIFALFGEAKKTGIQKLVVTHASSTHVVDEALSLEDQKQLANMGAYIEYTAIDIVPGDFFHDPVEIAKIIKAVGAQHCIISSDMGMAHVVPYTEGMKLFASSLMHNSITPEDIELMIKINPARLLDLD